MFFIRSKLFVVLIRRLKVLFFRSPEHLATLITTSKVAQTNRQRDKQTERETDRQSFDLLSNGTFDPLIKVEKVSIF